MRLEASSFFVSLLLIACGGGPAGSSMTGTDGGESTGATAPDTSPTTAGSSSSADTDEPPEDDSDGGTDTSEEPPPPPTSPTANLHFKGPQRLENDLTAVLELDPEQLCTEVGGASCTQEVHKVALGGVAPYDLGIYTPAAIGATAPIAVDRLTLQACMRRVDLDRESSDPVLFAVPQLGGGTADIGDPSAAAFIDALYTRALLRHPTEAETETLLLMHADIAVSDSLLPGRDWGVATCYAVLTTTEFLFY